MAEIDISETWFESRPDSPKISLSTSFFLDKKAYKQNKKMQPSEIRKELLWMLAFQVAPLVSQLFSAPCAERYCLRALRSAGLVSA